MSLKRKALFAAVGAPVLAAGVAGLAGCGGSVSNNDQGVVFLALGYFADSTGTIGVSTIDGVLSNDIGTSGIFNTDPANSSGPASFVGKQTITFLGLENRLRNQFIRLTKIDCEYNVPGSEIPIPPDSFAASGVITPNPGIGGPSIGGAGGSGDVGFGSSGGGSGSSGGSTGGTAGGGTAGGGTSTTGVSGPATGQGGRLFEGFPVMGPDIFAFLNNNRSALPELPFRVEAFCRATGVTSAGDSFATNEAGITITLFDVTSFPTPGTTGVTGGDGGDVTGFDGTDTTGGGGDTTTVDTDGIPDA